MDKQKLKVLLADDQEMITKSLSTYLKNYTDDIHIVGVAANGIEAVELMQEHNPDIILMDVLMPKLNGIEAVAAIKAKNTNVKIIMLSTYDDDEYVRSSILAGASGYLMKDTSPTELISAIRALKNNNIIQISPDLVRNMVQNKFKHEEKNEKSNIEENALYKNLPELKHLSNREKEVFTLLAMGYDNEKIAEKLFISIQSVKNHISIIYSKLCVKNRFEIIRLANKIDN
ncbi:MAG: response regulator transcription factor [Treponema sp.]|nr:response regulator transcription factor [Treponema sp.]